MITRLYTYEKDLPDEWVDLETGEYVYRGRRQVPLIHRGVHYTAEQPGWFSDDPTDLNGVLCDQDRQAYAENVQAAVDRIDRELDDTPT